MIYEWSTYEKNVISYKRRVGQGTLGTADPPYYHFPFFTVIC